MYAVFNIDTTGLSKNQQYSIKISAEVLAPDGSGVNYGKFHSLVRPPGNIPPSITQLMGI